MPNSLSYRLALKPATLIPKSQALRLPQRGDMSPCRDREGTEDFSSPKLPIPQTSSLTDARLSPYCTPHFKYTLKANIISLI